MEANSVKLVSPVVPSTPTQPGMRAVVAEAPVMRDPKDVDAERLSEALATERAEIARLSSELDWMVTAMDELHVERDRFLRERDEAIEARAADARRAVEIETALRAEAEHFRAQVERVRDDAHTRLNNESEQLRAERDEAIRDAMRVREDLTAALRELDAYRLARARQPSVPPPAPTTNRPPPVTNGSYSFAGGEERVDVVNVRPPTMRPPR